MCFYIYFYFLQDTHDLSIQEKTETGENIDHGPENRIGFGELRVQPHTTPSPTLVVPTKFEDLFAKPLIIVRAKGGRPQQVLSIEEFNKQSLKDGSALDRTREKVRNQLANPGFQQVLNSFNPSSVNTRPPSTTRRKKVRPTPFSKIPTTNQMNTVRTTLAPLRSQTFSTKPPSSRPPLPPMPTVPPKIRFHFFNNSVTSTTPLPKLRQPIRTSAKPQHLTTTRKPATPTLTTTISSAVTKTLGNVRDKMKAARNRLRILMGARPIGTTSRPRGKPNSLRSSPNKIEKERAKVLAMLQKQKDEEIKAAAIAAGHNIDLDYLDDYGIIVRDQELNLNSPPEYDTETAMELDTGNFNSEIDHLTSHISTTPGFPRDHQITVLAKSNFGGLNPTDNNLRTTSSGQSNNAQFNIFTTPATTSDLN